MWRRLSWGVAAAIAAIAAMAVLESCSEDPCFAVGRVVASSTSTDQGTVQAGLLQATDDWQRSATAGLAVRSDGTVVCVTCIGVVALEPSLQRLHVLDTPGPAGVVVARDDSVFAVVPGTDLETTDIVALDPAGQVRWRSTIGTRTVAVELFASDDGLYASAWRFTSMSMLPRPTLFAIDTATGAQRSVGTEIAAIGPAHHGVIAITAANLPDASTVVEQLDPAGNVVWSHTMRAFQRPEITGSLPTADGGVVVFGTIHADLDLGDLTIPFTAGDISNGVIIRFDATGAIRWGYAVNDGGVTALVSVGDDRFVAIGERQVGGTLFAPNIDSYLTVSGPAGVTSSLTIGGPGIQSGTAMAAAPDGTVWVQLVNVDTSDFDHPVPTVEIGDQRFAETGVYLFRIVP